MRRLANAIKGAWDTFREVMRGSSYFDYNSDERMTAGEWAAMMILHAEAVHDCHHTVHARHELGMAGPRGKAAKT